MMNLLISSALAQGTTAAAPAGGATNPLMAMIPYVLIFFVFYFLLIRPQKKRMEEEQKLLQGLNKGDEVFTKSGLIGKITGLTDKVVTLEVSEGVKVKVLRSQVAGPTSKIFEKDGAATVVQKT